MADANADWETRRQSWQMIETPRFWDNALHRRLVWVAAAVVAAFAALHFADHVVRGELVVRGGLDPHWIHSGWPFRPDFNLFDISFIGVFGLLLGGIVFTLRGRLWAGYWLVTSVILGALVLRVHFFVGSKTEAPRVIMPSYDNSALGGLALAILFSLFAGLVVMAAQALWVRRVSGRW